MTLLLAVVLALEGDLPVRLADPAPQEEKGAVADKEEIFGVELFVVSTQFDDGARVDDAVGAGADFNFRWKYRGKTRFGFSIGAAVWDSETDFSGLPDQDVDIAQYRLGVGLEFPFSRVELGIGATAGVYRFRGEGDESDTSPFLEFEGSLGFRPIPSLKIGGLLLATHTQSSFNRSHTHLFHNYAAGLSVEFSF